MRDVWIRLGAIGWFSLVLFAALGLGVVGALPAWMILAVVAAGLGLGAVVFLLRWLIGRRRPGFRALRALVASGLGGVLFAVGLAGLPFYAVAIWVEAGPTAVPRATLSNGTKTVVFQGMQHVASEEFYKAVVYDLEKALAEGYTLFYEGVQPVDGRPDLSEWFDKVLRGSSSDLSAGYVELARNCGLSFQLTYFGPLLADMALHPARHVTADVTYLALKTEYDRLMQADPGFAAGMAAKARAAAQAGPGPSVMPLLGALSTATAEQKRLVGILCRGVMGLTISGALGDAGDPSQRLILDFRNRALARFVAEAPAGKIYITYGAAHFPGFLAELQKLDPGFRVQSVTAVAAMTLPREAHLPGGVPVVRR